MPMTEGQPLGNKHALVHELLVKVIEVVEVVQIVVFDRDAARVGNAIAVEVVVVERVARRVARTTAAAARHGAQPRR